ncbi:GNAT family N-acetyltransferase [Xanthomonas pisi]|uniref:GNAT family N-acetyltransferase n=1 Tax=Xanthomonas pisi TaxID=56457 RepID=UPI000A41148A|nr:GNAT family N-acetyltransferase [Xanthomonas pisi]
MPPQVCDVAVHPHWQGRGLGKQVMQQLSDWMRANVPPLAEVSLLARGATQQWCARYGFVPASWIGMCGRF